MVDKKTSVIGSLELVEICGRKDVPAKIDTGADSSAIWASDVEVTKDGTLKFKLFGPESPFYSGKIIKRSLPNYNVLVVRSSNGHEQIRFQTKIPLKIAGKTIRVTFNLSDRSRNNLPILIGRTTLNKKFLVDVSKIGTTRPPKNPKTGPLQAELKKGPYNFYRKYVKLSKKGGRQ